jgi:hypothetical protein
MNAVMGEWDIIEKSYIKQPFLRGFPTKLVYIVLFQYDGIQLIAKWNKEFLLSIMRLSYKINVPLKRAIKELKMICRGCIP